MLRITKPFRAADCGRLSLSPTCRPLAEGISLSTTSHAGPPPTHHLSVFVILFTSSLLLYCFAEVLHFGNKSAERRAAATMHTACHRATQRANGPDLSQAKSHSPFREPLWGRQDVRAAVLSAKYCVVLHQKNNVNMTSITSSLSLGQNYHSASHFINFSVWNKSCLVFTKKCWINSCTSQSDVEGYTWLCQGGRRDAPRGSTS